MSSDKTWSGNGDEAHFSHLMSVPVIREGRMKTRDQVPYGPAKLASMARKFTTPVIPFGPPRKGDRLGEVPSYSDWLRSVGAAPLKRKRANVHMFEESPPEAWRYLPADPSI